MIVGKNASSKTVQNTDERKLRQGYVDLKKQTPQELTELIERQNKILRNKLFIDKLPDKGNKIICFREELQNELKKRQAAFDSACQLLSRLKLNDSNSEDFEWTEGKSGVSELDSDDEDYFYDCESDPLKLIASHSGTHSGKTGKISIQISDSVNKKVDYVDKMCKKYDAITLPKERFKPNQLKESSRDLADVSSENIRKRLGEKWEVTEATPPVFTIKNTKEITLSESIQLQKEHLIKIKEIEKKQAADKLLLNMNIKMGEKLPVKNTKEYRISSNVFGENCSDVEEEEEEEAADDDDEN